jgi:hypothetical protein
MERLRSLKATLAVRRWLGLSDDDEEDWEDDEP